MNIYFAIHGPINITITHPEESVMSALTDAVTAEVAEDALVVTALNDLAAKVTAGTATSADAQAAVDALNASRQSLSDALAADDPAPGVSATGTGISSAPGSAPGDAPAAPAADDVPPVAEPDPASGDAATVPPAAPVETTPVVAS